MLTLLPGTRIHVDGRDLFVGGHIAVGSAVCLRWWSLLNAYASVRVSLHPNLYAGTGGVEMRLKDNYFGNNGLSQIGSADGPVYGFRHPECKGFANRC